MQKDIYKISRINYVIEETLNYLITILISGAYLAKLTLSLGFSDSLTALVSSFVNLGCVFQLLAISIFKQGRVKRKVTIFYTINELLFVLLYLTPFFNVASSVRTTLFMLFLFGGYFLLNIASSPKTSWFMALIPDKSRGTFTACKEAISLVCGIVFRFTMGLLIDHFDKIGNTRASFITCGIVIFVFTIVHTLSLVFSKEKETEGIVEQSFFKSAKELICDKNSVSIILISILWKISNDFSLPFLGTYEIKELGFSMSYIAFIATASSVSRIIASFFLGRYADRKSFSKMLRICYILVGISFLSVAFSNPSTGYFMFFVYNIFMGAAMGGINSAEINLVFDIVSPEKRRNALAVKHTFGGIAGFSATLLATPLMNLLQRANLNLFGIHIYAQQVLAFVSFLLTIVLFLYITKLIKKRADR